MAMANRDSIVKESEKVEKQKKTSRETMSTKRFRLQRFIRGRRNETPAMAMASRDSIVKESEKVAKTKKAKNQQQQKTSRETMSRKRFKFQRFFSRASE